MNAIQPSQLGSVARPAPANFQQPQGAATNQVASPTGDSTTLSAEAAGQTGTGGPQQLDSQISSGDVQSAASTWSQMQSNKPADAPNNQTQEAALTQALQSGDASAAKQAWEALKAAAPAAGGGQAAQAGGQSLPQVSQMFN